MEKPLSSWYNMATEQFTFLCELIQGGFHAVVGVGLAIIIAQVWRY
jgi:hypothetical protein